MALVNTCLINVSADPSKSDRLKTGICSSSSERDLIRLESKKLQELLKKAKENVSFPENSKSRGSSLESSSFNQSPSEPFAKVRSKKIPVLARTKYKRRHDIGHFRFETLRKPEKNFSRNNAINKNKENHVEYQTVIGEDKYLNHLKRQSAEELSTKALSESTKFDVKEKSSESDICCNHSKIENVKLVASDISCSDGNESFSAVYNCRDFSKLIKDFEEKVEDELETKRQEKIIKSLYGVVKGIVETFFYLRNPEETDRRNSLSPSDPKPSTVQQFYDEAIRDIYKVWTDAIDLIKSVKDHTLLYVEKKSKMVDREQLTLEAEMLQLAVDFSVNFSKLKTDFLLKEVKKHLQAKEQEKNDLESFMDSKLLPAVYSLEDLSIMAETVRELNMSVLNGDDSDLE